MTPVSPALQLLGFFLTAALALSAYCALMLAGRWLLERTAAWWVTRKAGAR